MSIKDLFSKSIKSYESSSADVESTRFADNVAKERVTFLPPIDFSSASNFVKYGLAEVYYDESIKRIYNQYPYDGSEKEKIEFHLSSSYLDRWMYEKKYPKTTGYIVHGLTSPPGAKGPRGYGKTYASLEHIDIDGGVHISSDFSTTDPLSKAFELNSKYDSSKNREKTFKLDFDAGATFEFYLQKTAFDSDSDKEVILDLWNGEISSSATYGRVTIELTSSNNDLLLTVQNGTTGFFQAPLASLTLDPFKHYAITLKNTTSAVTTTLYQNGVRTNQSNLGSSTVNEIRGLVKGRIGALLTAPSSSQGSGTEVPGDGKLSGSLDEFRFWKTERSSRQIGLNYFKNVGGGANTDDATKDLGLYFKFNEGITGNNTTDAVVLDYSGRIANGSWTGYSGKGRDTGSAFPTTEISDPIIYSSHPQVISLVSEMQTSGSNYDRTYGGSLFNSMPDWMKNEDDNGNLKNINQVIASYFDTLHAQISALPDLRSKKYVEQGSDGNYKALPFMKNVLEDKGFMTRDIFIDSDVFENLTSYDENTNKFNKNLDEIKNLIYTNIYNNLEAIYKSKGTERSIRNLIRCFGVDDELVKLNVYTDGGTHYYTDKSKNTSLSKKYINFNSTGNFSSTIYQTGSVSNSNTFITGSRATANEKNNAFSVELDMIVPYKREAHENGYFPTTFLSSSLFGFHEAADNVHEYTWVTPETASLQVFLVRDEVESKRAKFQMKSRDGSINVSSPFIENIYDNTHWNVAVRVKPNTYPYAGNVTNNTPNYTVDLYAVNHNLDELINEINLTVSINATSGSAFLSNPKRIYLGAHLENFTGSVQQQSDIMVGGCRAWLDFLPNEAIKAHNKDASNFGNRDAFQTSNMFTIANKHIPSQDLKILNWDFDTVTGSNASGDFAVDDITSGSTNTIYGWPDTIIRREHRGRGRGFGASNTGFLKDKFVFALKKELPEISYTNENVFIKGDREINFIKDDDVSDNFFLLEKSMNAIVSEKMLETFSTIQEFANLIGRPEDRYRQNYKRLDKVRELFFNRVTADIDFETFTNYYKWIDSSVSAMISQLYPASVRFGEAASNVVESHILERNKIQNRIGLLDRHDSTEGSIRGVNELTYNWKFGHAPNYETYAYQNTKSLLMAQDANDVATTNFTTSDQYCLAFWFKSDANTDNNDIIKLQDSTNVVHRLDIKNATASHYRFRLKVGNSSYAVGNTINWSQTIADDTWVHVLLQVSGTGNIPHTASTSDPNSSIKLFVNGAEATVSSNTVTTAFQIGDVNRMLLNSNTNFDMEFDEMTFLTGTLTTSQINELYNAGNYFDPTSDAFSDNNSVVAHWRMGDTPGDTAALVQDVVSNHNFVINPNSSVSLTSDVFNQGQFVQNRDNVNCLWQKEREERSDLPDREIIRQVLVNQTNQTSSNLAQTDKTIYQGSTYARRKLSRPYAVSIGFNNSIHGGTNYSPQKNRNFVREVTSPHGGTFSSGAPKRVFGIGLGGGQGIRERQKCDDVLDPNQLYKFNADAVVGKSSDSQGGSPLSPLAEPEQKLKTEHYWPFNIISGSMKTGYNRRVHAEFKKDAIFANIHADTIDITNEVPMQGPFTNQWVGGNQARHVDINRHDTTLKTEGGAATLNNLQDQYTRPEAWRLLIGEHQTVTSRDGAVGFAGPDYGGPYPNITRKWAIYFREEKAKRPVNVKNIQSTTASANVGNYFHSYEFLNSFGKNKRHFVKSSGFALPTHISVFPETTQALSYISASTNFQVPEETINSSKNMITTRFSAPGGPEVNTRGYLDIATGEMSVYNSINFRNLSVVGSGSGEISADIAPRRPTDRATMVTGPSIRVNDQLNKRRGLRSLLNLHSGRFGVDPTHGSVVSTTYVTQPSFHKQHRNTLFRRENVYRLNRAINFSSTTATAAFPTVISAADTVSVHFWVRFDVVAGSAVSRTILDGNRDGQTTITILRNASQKLVIDICEQGNGSIKRRHTSSDSLVDNVWYFIGFYFRNNTTNVLTINGAAATTTDSNVGGSPSSPSTGLGTITIGEDSSNSNSLKGTLQNLALYSHNGPSTAGNFNDIYSLDVDGTYVNTTYTNNLIQFFQLGEDLEPLVVGNNLGTVTSIPPAFGTNPGVTTVTAGSNLVIVQGYFPGKYIDIEEGFHNTALITSLLPASDFQYSWVMNAISGSNWRNGQKVHGYAPRNGILSSSAGFTEAIVFPSSSALFGED